MKAKHDIQSPKYKVERELSIIKNGHMTNRKVKGTLIKGKPIKLSSVNKQIILRFYDACVRDGLSWIRIRTYLEELRRLATMIDKDFDKMGKEDVEKLVTRIQGSDLSDWSKQNYKICIKKFWKWLKPMEDPDMYPPEVKWIKTTMANNSHKLPEELLSENDVIKILKHADHPRDKAFLALLYETGARVGELGSMQIKHCSFDKLNTKITIYGKTGSRRLPLYFSTGYLKDWLNQHPTKDEPSSYIWIAYGDRSKGKPLKYIGLLDMVNRIVKSAGIKKAHNPHTWRHSRASFLAEHLTESQLCEYFGWTQGSKMPRTYVHLSGKRMEQQLASLHGLKVKVEQKESILKEKDCKRCGNLVKDVAAEFCPVCGYPMDEKIAIKMYSQTEKEQQELKARMDLLFQAIAAGDKTQKMEVLKAWKKL